MALTNETLQLRAKAKRAGIENYGSMSAKELSAALAGSGGSSKRKSAAAVGGKRKSASAVDRKPSRSGAKRKPAKTTPAAKSPKRGKAKRSSSGGKRNTTNTRKHERATASSNGRRSGKPGRNLIDRSQIDWTMPWAGGESGNRGTIMKKLRKHKGNYAKVYAALKDEARKMFPKSSKTNERYSADKSRAQLKWYIGRTAFDYVTGTKQHSKATNRKPDRRTNGKAPEKPSERSAPKRAGTSTRKRASAQAGSRKRTGGSSKRGSTKRKSVKR